MRFAKLLLASLFVAQSAFGAVAIVNTPSNFNGGGNYTAESGSSRLVVFSLCREASATGTTPTVTAASWGTDTLANSKITQAVTISQSALNRITCYIWYVKEADILSGAQTFSVTWSIAMGGANDLVTAHTLSNVDQTTPIDTTDTFTATSGTDPWTQSKTFANNTVQVLAAAVNANNFSSPDAAWTEIQDTSDTAYRRVDHDKTTSTGGSIAWTLDFAGTNTGAVAVASFAPASTPTFTSGPAASATTATTITDSLTPSASATDYMVAYRDTLSAPSCTQIKAGQDQTGSTAAGSNSKSVSGADTVTVTISGTPLPRYNTAHCLNNAGGDSSVSVVTGRNMAAPTGYQLFTLSSVGTGSPCANFNTQTDPDIAGSDILKAPTTTSPGACPLTIDSACQFSYSGCGAERELASNIAVYDASVGAYHADDIDFVANDPGIICSESFQQVYKVGQAISTLDFNQLCRHPLGDTLSFALTSGTWPTGLSLNGGTGALTGTPTVENESGANIVVTATSTVTGVTATQALTIYPIDTITMPDCQTSHLDVGSCIATLQSKFLDAGAITFSYSASVPAGNVLSQSAAPNTEVEPFATTDLVVSRGTSKGTSGLDLRMHLKQVVH